MSRTYRRKNEDLPVWVRQKSNWTTNGWEKWWLAGSELRAAVRRWHSESGLRSRVRPRKWDRQETQSEHRMRVKQSINRWIKDPEYPIQVPRRIDRVEYWT